MDVNFSTPLPPQFLEIDEISGVSQISRICGQLNEKKTRIFLNIWNFLGEEGQQVNLPIHQLANSQIDQSANSPIRHGASLPVAELAIWARNFTSNLQGYIFYMYI